MIFRRGPHKPPVVTRELSQPVTADMWDRIETNKQIATYLVRAAQHVDLHELAEKVRR